MTKISIDEIADLAPPGYEPTEFVLRELVKRNGGSRKTAERLMLGLNGHRTVREWVSKAKPIPRLCLAVLIAYDRSGEASV